MLENVLAAMSRIEEIKSRFRTAHVSGVVGIAPHAASDPELKPRFDKCLSAVVRDKTKGFVESASAYDALIEAAALRHELDPSLLKGVIQAESGFRADAVSPAGARGLMQLMPATAAALGVADPSDPAQSIEGGARYLRQQLDRFGDVSLALAAYNAGPGTVARYNGIPPYRETRNYVEKVLSYAEAYRKP